MKNTFKAFGFFMLILAIAFSSIACDGDGGGGPGGGGGGGEWWEGTYSGGGDGFITITKSGTVYDYNGEAGTASAITLSDGGTITGNPSGTWYNFSFEGNLFGIIARFPAEGIAVLAVGRGGVYEILNLIPDLSGSTFVGLDVNNYPTDGVPGNGWVGAKGGTGSNNDPHSLVITGITSSLMSQATYDSIVSIFPAGTSEANVQADFMTYFGSGGSVQYAVAGMDLYEGNEPDEVTPGLWTVTVPLYTPNNYEPWTGTGTFDIYHLVSDGSIIRIYKIAGISITSATTYIVAGLYQLIWDNEGDNNNPELDVPYSNMSNFGEWRKLDIRNAANQEVYYGYAKANLDGTVTFSTQLDNSGFVPIANGNYVINLFVFGKDVTYANYAALPSQGLDGDDAVAQYVYISSGQSIAGLGITDETSFMTNFSSLLTNIPTQGSSSYSITLPMLTNFRRMW